MRDYIYTPRNTKSLYMTRLRGKIPAPNQTPLIIQNMPNNLKYGVGELK